MRSKAVGGANQDTRMNSRSYIFKTQRETQSENCSDLFYHSR
jgi:hypothetical protein